MTAGSVDRSALLISRCPVAIMQTREAADAIGLRIQSEATIDRGADMLDRTARARMVLIGLADTHEGDQAALSAIADRAERRGIPVIATLPHEAIDLAAATLMRAGTQLLCEPSGVELAGAIALAGGGDIAPVLNEATRDGERRRLEHLHAEVARIAETLAGLARNGVQPGHVAAPSMAGGWQAQDETPDDGPSAAEIRKLINARRARDRFFDRELFADPAWDMLLDLYAAHLERVRVSVSSLCIAAAVPPTTALRWITTLREAGLFERQEDPFDKRRAFVALSEKARSAMRRYFVATGKPHPMLV